MEKRSRYGTDFENSERVSPVEEDSSLQRTPFQLPRLFFLTSHWSTPYRLRSGKFCSG